MPDARTSVLNRLFGSAEVDIADVPGLVSAGPSGLVHRGGGQSDDFIEYITGWTARQRTKCGADDADACGDPAGGRRHRTKRPFHQGSGVRRGEGVGNQELRIIDMTEYGIAADGLA